MPKTYVQVSNELQALQAEAEKLKKQESSEAIGKIKEAIATYGLTEQDLFGEPRRGAAKTAAKKKGKQSGNGPRYADGSGNVWGGMGPRPRWLREALSGGKKLEDFLAGGAAAAAAPEQGGGQEEPTPSQPDASDTAPARKSASAKKASAKKAAKSKTT